ARERLAGAGIPAEDGEDELLVRRVIARGGRTRAYVNGALGSLALLRELARHLLRVYAQDEHQALRRVESHRELLDAVGGLGRTLDEMRDRHTRLVAAREALDKARADQAVAGERIDLLRAQSTELERAALVPGEEEGLAAERGRLVHAERLAALATGAESAVYSGEGAAIEAIGRALGALREAVGLDPSLDTIRTLLDTALAELEEAGSALGRYVRGLAPAPPRARDARPRRDRVHRPLRRVRGAGARPRGLGRGRVPHLDESGRGAALARTRRVGRRALTDHARAQDPRRRGRARGDPRLRRGRRRHRRRGRRGGRPEAET